MFRTMLPGLVAMQPWTAITIARGLLSFSSPDLGYAMKSSHLPRRTLVIITLVIAALGGMVLLKPGRENPRPREPITLAVARQPLSAPVYVAQERGLFEQEGLEVTLHTFEAGKDALEAVLDGQHLLCTVAETPVMFAALHGERLALLATIAEAKNYV